MMAISGIKPLSNHSETWLQSRVSAFHLAVYVFLLGSKEASKSSLLMQRTAHSSFPPPSFTSGWRDHDTSQCVNSDQQVITEKPFTCYQNINFGMTASISEDWHGPNSKTGPGCSVNCLHVHLLTTPCRTSVRTNYRSGTSCVDEHWTSHTIDLYLNYGQCCIHWPVNNFMLCGSARYSDDNAVAPVVFDN